MKITSNWFGTGTQKLMDGTVPPLVAEKGSFPFIDVTVASGTKQQPPLNVWTVGLREDLEGEFPP